MWSHTTKCAPKRYMQDSIHRYMSQTDGTILAAYIDKHTYANQSNLRSCIRNINLFQIVIQQGTVNMSLKLADQSHDI